MVVVPPAVRLFILVSSRGGFGVDWLSNPWAGGLDLLQWDAPYELRKLQVSWKRTPTVGVAQDPAMCTFHFLNLTGGDPDATWTDADFVSVETAFDAFWTTIKPKFDAELKLAEYLWRKDGPAFRPHGAALSPTVRVVPRAVVGTDATARPMPPQCALSVTEVTAASFMVSGVGVPGDAEGTGRTQRRNRWGRFYLPPIGSTWTTDGRPVASVCTAVSDAVKTMYNACVAAGLIPVMYSPTTGSAWSVTEVHVDDIFDVIRSRRYITPTTRAINAINPP